MEPNEIEATTGLEEEPETCENFVHPNDWNDRSHC